jgi:hypothetical protein
MKKYLLLSLGVMLLMQACKRDTQSPIPIPPVKTLPGSEVIVIPEKPVGTPPSNGEAPLPNEPVSENIVYRKLNATLGYNKPIFLDANADGIVDFTFSSVLIQADNRPYLYLFVSTKSISGNKILVQKGPELIIDALYTPALEKNDVIGSNIPNEVKWTDPQQKGFVLGVSKTENTKDQYGLFINKTDKYLGILLKINNETHYGWIKLSHDSVNDEIIVSGFAYNKLPDAHILAGQK